MVLKIWACWEKTYQTSKAERKEVWFYAQLCFQKRWLAQLASCLVSRIFGVPVFTARLSHEGKTQPCVVPASPCTFWSHHISFHVLHFSPMYLLIATYAQFSLLCGLIFPKTLLENNTGFSFKNPSLLPLSSLSGSIPADSPNLLVKCDFYSHWSLHWHPVCHYTCRTHVSPISSAFSPALCFPNWTLSSSWIPFSQ